MNLKLKIKYLLAISLILNITIPFSPFIYAEETPTLAIEKAKFAIEQAQKAGADKSAPADIAAARSWLISAQKQYEEARSSAGWIGSDKIRRIKEETAIYQAVMAQMRATIAENRTKKERISKKLQMAIQELRDHQEKLALLKKDLAEAEKTREFQAKIEAEKRVLEELKRQVATLEQEKKLAWAEALSMIKKYELIRQKELDEVHYRERERAVAREKELAEVKLKAEELAKEKAIAGAEKKALTEELAKEKAIAEAEKKALTEKLANLQEKIALLELEKEMFFAANKISAATVKLTEKEIILTILAINLFTPTLEIKPGGKEILDEVGSFLNKYRDFQVIVRGHTDSLGNPVLNQTLSEKRAQKVREYLVAYQHILPSRIIAEGWGPSQPIAPNDTEFGRTLNRRVEIVVITRQQN